jgi:hypothetical protein
MHRVCSPVGAVECVIIAKETDPERQDWHIYHLSKSVPRFVCGAESFHRMDGGFGSTRNCQITVKDTLANSKETAWEGSGMEIKMKCTGYFTARKHV